jgi:hypothetical protein
MRVLGLSVFVAAVAGCGGNQFALSDAGTETGAQAEASGTAADGPPADGGAPHPDDGAPQDAASNWCKGQSVLFCADFDEQSNITTLLASWTTFSMTPSDMFSLAMESNVPSPPNALQITAGDHANALLEQAFPAPARRPTKARLEFDLRIDNAGNVSLLSAAGFAAIAVGTLRSDGIVAMALGNGPTLAAVWLNPADAGAGDAGMFGSANSTQPFPALGQWSGRYALEITYPTDLVSAAHAQIYSGSTPLLSSPLTLPLELSAPRQFVIALGDSTGGLGLTGLIQLQFDNVTFDLL